MQRNSDRWTVQAVEDPALRATIMAEASEIVRGMTSLRVPIVAGCSTGRRANSPS